MKTIVKIAFWLRLKIESNYALILAKKYIKAHRTLKEIIEYVDSVSDSIGLSLPDYVSLYSTLKRLKPQTVLECGTGKSTFIIAQAMIDNKTDTPKLISMEENKQWYEASKTIVSKKFDFVKVCLSDVNVYKHSFFCGSCYKSIPEHAFDFVLIDGPKLTEQNNLNMDFIRLLKKSKKPMSAWIDGRLITFSVFSAMLGRDKVKYYRPWNNTVIENVTPNDLKDDHTIARLFSVKSHMNPIKIYN